MKKGTYNNKIIAKKDILVSVIIPNYNRTTQLKRAVQSVLDQTLEAFEIYIVDDKSEIDPTLVIQGFKDDRIHIIKLPEKKNAAYARNVGITNAQGKYIAFLDSDDAYLPNHFEKRIKLLENSKYDGTYGSIIKMKKDNQEACISYQVGENDSMLEYLLSGRLRACTPSLFLKIEPTKNILFDEALFQHQDYDFNIRFHRRYKLLCDPDPSVLVYYDDENKMSNTINHSSCLSFIDKYEHTISKKIYHNYLFQRLKEEKVKNGKTAFYHEYRKRLLSGKFRVKNYIRLLTQKYYLVYAMVRLYDFVFKVIKPSQQ